MSRTRLTIAGSLFVFSLVAAPGLHAGTAPQILEYNAESALHDTQQKSGAGLRALSPLGLRRALEAPTGQGFLNEVEPNGTTAEATALGGTDVVVRGGVYPAADVDVYSFTAGAGDLVYAGIQSLSDASASGDSVMELLDPGGVVLETDLNDGTFNASSSNIAGAPTAVAGTYFLRVRHNTATGTIRPYHLHFKLQSGAPVAEVEPNNTTATATPLPASGWVSGTVSAVSPGETDFYSVNLATGDSVFIALDMNPERDAAVWNGRLGFGLFGNPPANQLLLANDANAGASPTDPNSEGFYFTALTAGTYFVYVDSIVATGLGPTATYTLSLSVHPAVPASASCTTYTSTDVPQTIPTGPGLVSSTISVPGNPRIADLDVSINLNHTFMQDVDAHLVSPAGNDNGLFTDIGAATVGGAQTLMDVTLDDEAALPPAFALTSSFGVQPELAYRLSWFDGEDAGGTWTLTLRDDAATDGGTLNAWSLTICEPPPPPACAPGTIPVTVFSSDFEANDGGFTHSGTADEWEWGSPTFAPIVTCGSGVSCWKTDLDNTYDASNMQDLLSPAMDLTGLVGPIRASWSQRYHIESATFDHAFVDAQRVGGVTPTRLFEWRDATMNNTVGNPGVTIPESAGWARYDADVTTFMGQNDFQLRFHLDGDTTVQLAGLAIDDVTVSACRLPSADLSITKTDGVGTATPGGSVIYTISASNAGADDVTGGNVTDTFPGVLTCTWTCVGSGGGICTAAGAGDINDTVDLPNGASVTYTASCTIAASATGTLANTATVSSGVNDPDPANNGATDSDTLTPLADLAITNTDSPDPIGVHRQLTYTLGVTNSGPSDAAGVNLSDTLPAGVTFVSASAGCTGTTTVTCNVGALAAGASANASIVVSTDTIGTPSNTASVSASTSDPNAANDSSNTTTTVRFLKGDLDNDLNTDLYLRNLTSNSNQVWIMNGVVQSSSPALNPATPASATQQVAGVDDFDGDFRNDLVFWNTANGAVEFWLMNGVDRIGAPVPISGAPTLAPSWKLSATADFNNDGNPDIVWRNQTSQKIVLWTMNGTGKLGNIIPSPDQAVNANWEIVGALDLNADGNTDFLWYNSTSGKIVYWWMDASVVRTTGNFTTPDAAGNNNWKVLAGGDYGVGPGGVPDSNDVVWRNATSGKFVVWYMNTAGIRTAGTFTTPDQPAGTPTDWIIVGPR